MVVKHTRCSRVAPYYVEAAGLLQAERVNYGSFTLIVSGDDTWKIEPGWGWSEGALNLRHTIIAPAIYDAHVHLYNAEQLRDFARYGVCRIRDLGSPAAVGESLGGRTPCSSGPEIAFGGPLFDRAGEPRLPAAAAWSDFADLQRLLDQAQDRGATWAKLYAGFPVDLASMFIKCAHSKSLRVAAHPRPSETETLIRSGVDEIEHIASLARGDARALAGTAKAAYARWAHPVLASERSVFIQLLSDTTLCPTLAVHRRLLDAATHRQFPIGSPDELVSQWQGLRAFADTWSDEEIEQAEVACNHMATCAVELLRAGVRVIVGSDTPNPGMLAGAGIWDEINALIAGGLPTIQAYLAASVYRDGMGAKGDSDLAFLPVAWMTSVGKGDFWPVSEVAGVVRAGCLFVNETSLEASNDTMEARVTQELGYRRSPNIVAHWQDDRLTIVHARTGRHFALSAKVIDLLDVLNPEINISQLSERVGISDGQVTKLLALMEDAGFIERAVGDTQPGLRGHDRLSACEWAVHSQPSRIATPAERHRPAPLARLSHPEASARISLTDGCARTSKSLKAVLADRRSIRRYGDQAMPLEMLGIFLSDACRVRGTIGQPSHQVTHRSSPSAGARHSLEIYVFARNILGLDEGIYHYDPFGHLLCRLAPWDAQMEELQQRLVCGPGMLQRAPHVSFYLTSVVDRVVWKYPGGALPLIYRDTGCLLQTMYLVATDLSLAPCALAAIDSELTPEFLAPWRDQMIHVGSFALGTTDNSHAES